jgi:hypothetical protein
MSKQFEAVAWISRFCCSRACMIGRQRIILGRFIGEVTEELDLSEIYGAYEGRDGRRMAAYHSLLMRNQEKPETDDPLV